MARSGATRWYTRRTVLDQRQSRRRKIHHHEIYPGIFDREHAGASHYIFLQRPRPAFGTICREGMYRSLLCRLLEKVPRLQQVVKLPWFPIASQRWEPSVLQDIFRKAVLGLQQERLMMIVDALEEGDQAGGRAMVEYLESLTEVAPSRKISLEACYSSRHYPHITAKITGLATEWSYFVTTASTPHFQANLATQMALPYHKQSTKTIVQSHGSCWTMARIPMARIICTASPYSQLRFKAIMEFSSYF